MSLTVIYQPRVLTPEATKQYIRETQRKHQPAHFWFFWGCLWTCAVWAAVIFGIYFAMKGKP